MSLVKRSILSILRRPYKTCVILTLLSLSMLSSCICTFFYSSAKEIELFNSNKAGILIQSNYNSIPLEIVNEINDLYGIYGYNSFQLFEIAPINFENYVDDTLIFDMENSSFVDLSVNENTKLNDIFRDKQAMIIEGNYPSKNNVLVDEKLAQFNKLNIGDTITFKINNNRTSAVIGGIYKLIKPIEIQYIDSAGNLIYSASPKSRVFANSDFMSENSSLPDNKSVYFYINDLNDLNDIMKQINNITVSSNDINVYDATDYIFRMLQESSRNNLRYLKIIIFVIVLASILIVSFTIQYLQKSMNYDFGILLAIGESKNNVVNQLFLTIAFMLSIASFVAVSMSLLGADYISKIWINAHASYSEGAMHMEFYKEIGMITENMNRSWIIKDILIVVISFYTFSLIPTMYTFNKLVKQRPRYILNLS